MQICGAPLYSEFTLIQRPLSDGVIFDGPATKFRICIRINQIQLGGTWWESTAFIMHRRDLFRRASILLYEFNSIAQHSIIYSHPKKICNSMWNHPLVDWRKKSQKSRCELATTNGMALHECMQATAVSCRFVCVCVWGSNLTISLKWECTFHVPKISNTTPTAHII